MKNKRQLALNACHLLQAHRWWGHIAPWHGLVSLNYHRIGQAQNCPLDPELVSATPEQFEAQLRYLKLHFDVIRVGDIADVLRPGSRRRAVLITFDDGYLDNYEVAFPLLKQEGVPATIFLSTGFLDQRGVAWWDEIVWMVKQATGPTIELPAAWNLAHLDFSIKGLRSATNRLIRFAKTLTPLELTRFLDDLGSSVGTGRAPRDQTTASWMTWDMVREMSRAGIEFGGHTVNHPVLSRCTVDEQRHEIVQSKARIEAEIGQSITAFSYPTGQPWSFTDDTMRLVREAGFQWGFSYYSGFANHKSNPYDLQRVAIEPSVSLIEFQTILQIPGIFAGTTPMGVP